MLLNRLDILKWLQMTAIQSEHIWAQFGNRIAGACRDQWAEVNCFHPFHWRTFETLLDMTAWTWDELILPSGGGRTLQLFEDPVQIEVNFVKLTNMFSYDLKKWKHTHMINDALEGIILSNSCIYANQNQIRKNRKRDENVMAEAWHFMHFKMLCGHKANSRG